MTKDELTYLDDVLSTWVSNLKWSVSQTSDKSYEGKMWRGKLQEALQVQETLRKEIASNV